MNIKISLHDEVCVLGGTNSWNWYGLLFENATACVVCSFLFTQSLTQSLWNSQEEGFNGWRIVAGLYIVTVQRLKWLGWERRSGCDIFYKPHWNIAFDSILWYLRPLNTLGGALQSPSKYMTALWIPTPNTLSKL